MNMTFAVILAVVIVSCSATPVPQGKAGAEITKNSGSKPNLNVYGSQTWSNDRGRIEASGNHQRELGGLNRHQTNVGVRGEYDVFKSDNGKTKGTVFGGANKQWNSHGPNNRGYEYGGRVEHTWGKK